MGTQSQRHFDDPDNPTAGCFFTEVAIGLAELAIALMTRRGYIGAGAVTPGFIVVAVAIIELLLAEHLTPGNFVPFMLSLWLPGIGLLVLGVIYVAVSVRV